jgi:hypothetical protein
LASKKKKNRLDANMKNPIWARNLGFRRETYIRHPVIFHYKTIKLRSNMRRTIVIIALTTH